MNLALISYAAAALSIQRLTRSLEWRRALRRRAEATEPQGRWTTDRSVGAGGVPSMMSSLLFVLHPATAMAVVAAIAVALLRRPVRWSWFSIALLPVAGIVNSLLWLWFTPVLLGWRLGGLGGWAYLYQLLPINGLLAALGVSIAVETAVHDRVRSPATKRLLQVVGVLIVLAANLFLARFAGNLRGNLTD